MKPSNDVADIRSAIQAIRCLLIDYDPGQRLIEPHALGYGSDGQLLLRAYQVSGASASGEHEHWKLFRVDRIRNISEDVAPSAAPRDGYKRGDRAMKGGIIEQL